MAVQNDFSKGSILSHMARIALPMTLAQFVNILYNIIDRVFIGRIPDHATEALTGLGVAFPICTLAIAFANLVGMGGAPLFSIERGKGNEEEAKYFCLLNPCADTSSMKADKIPILFSSIQKRLSTP